MYISVFSCVCNLYILVNFVLKAQGVVWQYDKSSFTSDNNYKKSVGSYDTIICKVHIPPVHIHEKNVGGLKLNQMILCENSYCLPSDDQNSASIKFACHALLDKMWLFAHIWLDFWLIVIWKTGVSQSLFSLGSWLVSMA